MKRVGPKRDLASGRADDGRTRAGIQRTLEYRRGFLPPNDTWCLRRVAAYRIKISYLMRFIVETDTAANPGVSILHPCQGWGWGFESPRPLQYPNARAVGNRGFSYVESLAISEEETF